MTDPIVDKTVDKLYGEDDSWPRITYQGRKWDAPFTDDAVEGEISGPCDWCREEILPDDNAVKLPYMTMHLECHLRMALGNVKHLRGDCICHGGSGGTEPISGKPMTLREEAREALQWLVKNYRGRFHE